MNIPIPAQLILPKSLKRLLLGCWTKKYQMILERRRRWIVHSLRLG